MEHDSTPLDRRLLLGAAGLAGFAALASTRAKAGPLEPPTGPVASTTKPLGEVEPRTAINATNTPGDADCLFKITQPGSYYLTGNITGVAGKHGIKVEVPAVGGLAGNAVTIDLNGFSLVGVSGSLNGVSVTVGANGPSSFSLTNGFVRGWGQSGISGGSWAVLSRLQVYRNGANGVVVTDNAHISDCTALTNTLDGIRTGRNSNISRCTANYNGGHGIVNGEQLGGNDMNSTVTNCIANTNAGNGFQLSANVVVTSCSAGFNGVDGFAGSAACVYSSCVSQNNIRDGYLVSSGSMTGCVASVNGRYGVNAAIYFTVRGCSLLGSMGDNIRVSNSCHVVENFCTSGGNGTGGVGDGANIHAIGTRNRIEGNYCINGDRGIQVEGVLNTIVRNVCTAGANHYVIAANNFYGTIVNLVDVATPAVASTAAPGTMVATDANTNFMY